MEGQGLRRGDKLVLRGLKFHGHHGVKAEEKNLVQLFLIDMEASLDLRQVGQSDSLDHTVGYTDICRTVKTIVECPPFHNRLESVAHRIADDTLGKFSRITAVRVVLGKSHVPQQLVDWSGVEILKEKIVDQRSSDGGASMGGQGLHEGDKLVIRGLKVHGKHGMKDEEKKLGQTFQIDVDAWLDPRQAGETDSLADTVSYTDICSIVAEIIGGQSRNLLETVAHRIAVTTLSRLPKISAVRVMVGKLHGPVYLGVEILRDSEDGKEMEW